MSALSNEMNGLWLQNPPAQLPLLDTLVLMSLSPTDIVDILRIAATPNCRRYTISIDSWHLDSMVFTTVAERIQQLLETRISSCRVLEIHLNDIEIRIVCRTDRYPYSDFNLTLGWGGSDERVFDWLSNMLLVRRPLLSPIPIELYLQYSRVDGSPPSPSSLFQLSGVRSLMISGYQGWAIHLVEALSTPRDSENDNALWMWPNLREVTVIAFNGSSLKALLHMVETRAEAALHWQGTEVIAMLERLDVRGLVFTSEELEAIRAITRDVVVVTPINPIFLGFHSL
ncbi:hypothetical protein FRB93_005205 [Tulasnella sp. JGI-2019a]|nr:hypothetical protein FRB93_005205 [Tulasnella sp. JGI-2019a]